MFIFVASLKFFVYKNLPAPLVTFTSSASTTTRPVNDQSSQVHMIDDDDAHNLDEDDLLVCDVQVKKKQEVQRWLLYNGQSESGHLQ